MARKTTKPTTTRTKKTKEASTPKPGKPVFRLGTLITLVLFLAVIGAAYYLNQNPIETEETADATPTSETAFVFDAESVVTSIEVKPALGETVKLERNEEMVWMLTQPIEGEADPAFAEAAASQIPALSISSEIDGDPSIFGFETPGYTITVGFEDGKASTIEVGDTTPTETGYYVRVDGKKMYIVGLEGIASLTQLVDAPPYLATPTASPTASPIPTETPVPATSEATPTP